MMNIKLLAVVTPPYIYQQSPRLEYNMKTMGIEQSWSNRLYVEHKCLDNIKKIYQHSGRCYDQQNLKYIIDAVMVPTPEEVTDFSPSLHITQTTIKKTSSIKSLFLFTNIFYI